jgi:hypothetical protein
MIFWKYTFSIIGWPWVIKPARIFDRDAEWGQLARFAARVGQRVTTGSPPAAGD